MTVASPIQPCWRARRSAKIVAIAVALLLLTVSSASAQQFALSSADLADSAALATSTHRLAGEVLASYRDPDRGRYLDNVFRLQFTIYADSVAAVRDALLSAAHGYASVTGYTRGKACSNDTPVPYVHDGADAAALIDWIARQPWSDGRVGMYGGSYSGFTAWAAAKRRPSALKGIMVGAPVAPGIDVPMEGNIFVNFVYPWPFYTTNDRWLDNATYNDNARWQRLNRTWYTSGRPYRELEQIDGTPNPGFAEWIAHPTIDAYWRAMVPHGEEFAGIEIPVLQTAGYFFGGPGGAAWYANEHYRHHPGARHYLVIGPYDHLQAQRGVVTVLGHTATWIAGYTIDPVAGIDIVASLRYQWFDHVLRGSPRPALLQDRVNYQVTGANTWRHAPTLSAVSNDRLRLYLHPGADGRHSLASAPPDANAALKAHGEPRRPLRHRRSLHRRPPGDRDRHRECRRAGERAAHGGYRGERPAHGTPRADCEPEGLRLQHHALRVDG